jgi:hypothetical protein
MRASTTFSPLGKDVDGRDKPGHDERGGAAAGKTWMPAFAGMTGP